MAEYKVFLNPISSDHDSDPVVEVKAESVEFHAEDGDYNFYPTLDEEGEPVFVIPAIQVRFIQRVEDDEPSDICLGCGVKELLGSEDFFNAVYDIVDSYHEPDGPEPLTVFQGQHGYGGFKSWGFWFFDDEQEICVFVPFGNRVNAEEGLQRHKNGGRGWGTWPLSETTPVEETIQ